MNSEDSFGEKEARSTGPALCLFAIFFINFFSLVYQVLWLRKIMLVFGTTALAISTVLSVFLAGIALGGYLGGIWIRRAKNGYRFAAIVLAILGIYCFFAIHFFGLIGYPFFYLAGSLEGPFTVNLLKFFFSFLILIVPTTLIGAMFPIITHLYSQEFKRLGRDVASVYSLDTLGAALGAVVCGFILVPALGLRMSSNLSAIGYIVLAVLLYMKRAGAMPSAAEGKARVLSLDRDRIMILCVLFVSGFAALVLEVTWARYFHLIFGTSIYAFSLVIAAFLLGLSVGSFLIRRYLDRIKHPMLAFAFIAVLIAGFSLLVVASSGFIEAFYHKRFYATGNFYVFQGTLFIAAFMLMLVPTMLMGANFPLAVRLFARGAETRGSDAGLVFSINTAGGIVGAFAAGFLVIPVVGLESAAILASLFYLAMAFVLIYFASGRFVLHAAIACAIALPFFIFSYVNYGKLSLDISVYYSGARFKSFEEFTEGRKYFDILYSKQGYYGLVSVTRHQEADVIFLMNNGKSDASTLPDDMRIQLMLGHTPFFFHRDPQEVLYIGLGGGLTLGAVISHSDVKTIDSIEIDPLVVEAVDLYFSPYNDDALSDPRVQSHVEDGRHFLETTAKKYDVIISTPPNIWVSGVSQLFTREFYEIVDNHLTEGGILAQWIPFYEMADEDRDLILNTIRHRFRYVSYWDYGDDVVVLASGSPLSADAELIKERFSEPLVASHFDRIVGFKQKVDPEYLTKVFSGDRTDWEKPQDFLDELERTDALHSDNRPNLEFKSVRNVFYKLHGR